MAMDFFQSQDVARKSTGRLVILFILAVIAIMALVYLLVAAVIYFGGRQANVEQSRLTDFMVRPELALGVGAATIAIVGLGSLYKIIQLRAGGAIVAESLGGELIHPQTTDPTARRLLNVVEEMAIASGTPCPPVYLLQEKGINAFAAGYSPENAVIGVTRGCAEQLTRDQLQGVIAHEFSHILNGDMRMNIRLIGILNGILIIGIIGYFIFRSALYTGHGYRRSDRRGNPLPLLALGAGLAAIGFVGTFFGNWIKAAVSRQREFLADASAVQFTRNPSGIAGALKRIGGYGPGTKIENPNAPEASHMFFGRAITSGLSGMFSTHPPLPKRIRRIEPSWEGDYITDEPMIEEEAAGVRAGVSGFAAGAAGTRAAEKPPAPRASAIEQIGRPTEDHIDYAAQLISRIPPPLADAARESYGARAVVYALLMNDDPTPRRRQTRQLDEHADPGVCRLTGALLPVAARLPEELRLPLADLTLPALRALSTSQYQVFKRNVDVLVEADEKIDLFEWTLQRMILRHLQPHFTRVRPRRAQYYALNRLQGQCTLLLSMLAYVGHADRSDARHAFDLGARKMGLAHATLLPPEQCSLKALDHALDMLNRVTPRLKRQIIIACAASVSADREVTVAEAELFRAIGDALSCPMPPLLPGQRLT